MHDDFTTTQSDPGLHAWGYGKVNAYEGLKECLQLASGIEGVTAGGGSGSHLVSTDNELRLLFTAEARHVSLLLTDVSGKTLWKSYQPQVSMAEEISISTGSLPSGVYLLQVVSDCTRETYKILVQ